jgi:CO/xanthine dehydrogenase Mo-binding subunit
MANHIVGQPVPRKEGREKVTGRALYVDDLTFPGMLYGATVRSPAARGRIRGIHFSPGIPWNEFTIVTARDIPGRNCIYLDSYDQPCLAADRVNHPEEPVALLAHPDKSLLEAARRAVQVDIEPAPAVFTIEESLAGNQIVWGEDNIFKSILVEKGDVDRAWAEADFVVEGEYTTGAQEQLYIEPQGMIAMAAPGEGVTVWGSLQCPYYIQKALGPLFGLPAEQLRVIQTETGGAFGGKEEYPSMIAAHAALLAWKSGRPVKIIYDRVEDMAATTKRHPSRTRHRTAVARDGRLVAMEIDFALDGGAYMTLSPVVLSRGTIHAAGPYNCPNVRIRSRAVATNAPPHGAFRGFGAPQSIFALERHLDRVARAVGMTPEALRRRNLLRQGEVTAVGQVVKEHIELDPLMDRAFELSDYHAKLERFERENPGQRIKKGIGFAVFYHGSGFTGSGEVHLESVVGVEATADGRARILAASVEMGQGTNTMFAQIAADALGIACDQVEIAQPDTADVPNSGPTVASRTCMIVGKLVETAAAEIKQKLIRSGLLREGYRPEEFSAACREYIARHGPLAPYQSAGVESRPRWQAAGTGLAAACRYQPPPGIHWDEKQYRGDAYSAYAWAVYVAEVSVDTTTGETRVDDFVAVQEVGKVINPVLAAGQIEGGIAQGIGYALYENVVWQEGRMVNCQMTNYIMPTSADLPRIRVWFEELPYPYGPAGAKGLGELPMDGTAPAIVNAIEQATGISLTGIPATPEALLEALASAGADAA